MNLLRRLLVFLILIFSLCSIAQAATGTMVIYHSWSVKMGEGANLSSDTFKLVLASSSYTPSQSTHDEYADLTNLVSTGNGYTSPTTLSSCTWTQTSGTAKFDCADVTITASGGSVGPARYFIVYDDTVAGDPLVGYGLLDNTPADVTITDGNTLTIVWNSNGLFTSAIQ